MKHFPKTKMIVLSCVVLCGLKGAAQVGLPVAAQNGSSHTPAKRVMAPPPETRANVKLRPSTAEAGQSRTAKPPLKVLPAIKSVSSPTAGKTVGSPQFAGHWLMLYRTDPCVACDRLMNVLAASDSADLRNGVPYTIIVGGHSALDSVRAKYSTLRDATWAADLDLTTFKMLQLRGTPELFAMDGNRIIWRISGNLGNPQQVLRLADLWIAGIAAADAAAKEKAANLTKASVAAAPGKQ